MLKVLRVISIWEWDGDSGDFLTTGLRGPGGKWGELSIPCCQSGALLSENGTSLQKFPRHCSVWNQLPQTLLVCGFHKDKTTEPLISPTFVLAARALGVLSFIKDTQPLPCFDSGCILWPQSSAAGSSVD